MCEQTAEITGFCAFAKPAVLCQSFPMILLPLQVSLSISRVGSSSIERVDAKPEIAL
jgi:hypothetical protein